MGARGSRHCYRSKGGDLMVQRHSARPVGRSVTAAGLAVVGLLLSGCGGSPGIHPAAAAVIGGDTISMDTVKSPPTLCCRAYLPQLQQQRQKVPMRYLRQFVAGSLAERALGRQLADEYAVQPSPAYAT